MRTIIEMVAATRLDCVLGSAALMRQAVAQAIHHCTLPQAFGGLLVDKPLMRNVLADLALESEAATTLGDAAGRGVRRRERAGAGVPAARGAGGEVLGDQAVHRRWSAEALECLGGNGYVEESGHAAAVAGVAAELDLGGRGQRPGAGRAAGAATGAAGARRVPAGGGAGPRRRPPAGRGDQGPADRTRRPGRRRGAGPAGMVERIALVLQGSLLVRYAPPEVADAFCASRLGGDWGAAFGTLPHALDLSAILARATPAAP